MSQRFSLLELVFISDELTGVVPTFVSVFVPSYNVLGLLEFLGSERGSMSAMLLCLGVLMTFFGWLDEDSSLLPMDSFMFS